MINSIFSTYTNEENQVTSTILAVFEKLNSKTVTQILQLLMEDSTVELIKYENQIQNNGSIPDGRIKGLFDYIIETKIKVNTINPSQIEEHFKMLKYDFSRLLILTPDYNIPKKIKELPKDIKEKVIWGNFDKIVEGINSVLENSVLLVDLEKFLLIELRTFIINKRLITEDFTKRALIIPAGKAWGFYINHSFYKCQPNRSFKPSSYMGFYENSEIKETFPKILGYVDCLNILTDNLEDITIITNENIDPNLIKEKLKSIKETLPHNEINEPYKYIILTELNNKDNFIHNNVIKNNKTSYASKGTAFVQKQRYFNIDELDDVKYTNQIQTT